VLAQRVREARVAVNGAGVAAIGAGLLLLVGVRVDDGPADREWLVRKVLQLRIFDDAQGVMNRSVQDVGGALLAVSQFTLYAATRKGNRPSYSDAAPPAVALPAFEAFVAELAQAGGVPVSTGVFGAHMQVSLVNDGPVTIWLDSRER
jgi:D-tyrosyl-tRNA(Tyr) deacylase